MATAVSHKLLFPLPVFIENYGRGYVTLPQECENVNWRCGLMGEEGGKLGIQLMCNQEDRSTFWSLFITFEFSAVNNGQVALRQTGKFHFKARKFLLLRLPLATVMKVGTKKDGLLAQFHITSVQVEGIRPKRIHDFSVRHPYLHNMAIVIDGKKIYCSKQIVAMNSEVFLDLLYPDGNKDLTEIKLPDEFEYEKILRLIKVFYNDSDALNAANIDETLEMATNLKSDNARQRCERWISRTPSMSAQRKMNLAEKYGLVELQNECVGMLKTSQQVQRLFENPHDFTDDQIAELMNRVTLSIVGHSYNMSQ